MNKSRSAIGRMWGWCIDGEMGNESGFDCELAAEPRRASVETARKVHNHNSICNEPAAE